MGPLLLILGYALGLVGLVCWIIILIDAFKNEVWKGLVCFLCFIYAIYYALVEFKHEKKGLIIAGLLVGWFIGGGLQFAGTLMSGALTTPTP